MKKNNAMMASLLALSSTAMAHETGDILLRAGAATVAPHESSSQVVLQSSNTALGKIGVDNDTQLGLTLVYMMTDKVGVELLAATPFNHTIKGTTGAVGNLNLDIATSKQLPPTISTQYYPLKGSSLFQPYLGVGINYTAFFDSQTTHELNTALGVSQSSIDIDNSWGLAEEMGVDYMLNEHTFLNAAVWHIDINTHANINLNNGADRLKVNVDIDPWVYMAAVGYKF
jgi:outer membrane protein